MDRTDVLLRTVRIEPCVQLWDGRIRVTRIVILRVRVFGKDYPGFVPYEIQTED